MPVGAGATTGKSFTAPVNIVATPADSKNNITFNSVSGAIGYNLYWHTVAGFSIITAVLNGQVINNISSGDSHSGLTNGITYYYIITAYDATIESEASGIANSTPFASTINVAVGGSFNFRGR